MEMLLTESEAAEWMKVSRGTMSNWRMHHRGPCYIKDKSFIRYRPEDLREYVESHSVPAQNSIPDLPCQLESARHWRHNNSQQLKGNENGK